MCSLSFRSFRLKLRVDRLRVFLLSIWFVSKVITEFLSHVALLFTVNFLAIIIIKKKDFYDQTVSPRLSLRSFEA